MNMIQVTIGNNVNRTNVILNNQSTLRSALEGQNIDYTKGSILLDGVTLQAGSLDKTFADFGITSQCYLMQVVKADNA